MDGIQTGDEWPLTSWGLPVASNDLTMPHTLDIWNALWDPVQRADSDLLAVFLIKAAWFTLKEAALGFVLGTAIGLGLAVVMLRFKVAERGMLPWVNISQTVPLIALAPIVVTWGRTNGWGDLLSVALISTYLTFFPVAVNGLKGLQSPAPPTSNSCGRTPRRGRRHCSRFGSRRPGRTCSPRSSSRQHSALSVRSSVRSPPVFEAAWAG